MTDDQDAPGDAERGDTDSPEPRDGDGEASAATEGSHERMERCEALAEQEQAYGRQKRAVLDAVGEDLTSAVERALDAARANVVVESTGGTGTTQTLGVRLDRAALVARIADELPEGFGIDSLNDDGTITLEWRRRTDNSAQARADAVVKAIVAEETTTDADGLIESVPRRGRVVDRAVELDVSRELATQPASRRSTCWRSRTAPCTRVETSPGSESFSPRTTGFERTRARGPGYRGRTRLRLPGAC